MLNTTSAYLLSLLALLPATVFSQKLNLTDIAGGNRVVYQVDITNKDIYTHHVLAYRCSVEEDSLLSSDSTVVWHKKDTTMNSLSIVVLDLNGDPLASLSCTLYKDINNDLIGSIDTGGVIRDGNYHILGYIDGNYIKDAGGNIWYGITGIPANYAASLLFFVEFI